MATTHANVRDPNTPSGGGGRPTAQEPPEGLLSMARGRLNTELNARKDRVSAALDELANTVRRVGIPLRDQSPAIGGYVDQAADQLKRTADGLRERDIAELATEVEQFGRRYPGAFLATGFAAGLLAARFFRSSAPEPEPSRAAGGTGGGAGQRPGGRHQERGRQGRESMDMKAPRRA